MYKSLANNPEYALNAICPYYTMFPLEYPMQVLKKYMASDPIVLDPFCGRGTTIYAARTLGLNAWGIDSSPIAVAIAKAKLACATLDEIMELASHLIAQEPSHIPNSPFFKNAYAKSTLKQICALREGLLNIREETGASILLKATALGCLHGPLNKSTENAAYFSNQMPRTFSSKPDYSVRFWQEKGLKAPKVNILNVLKRKLSRIPNIDTLIEGSPRQIINCNSCSPLAYTEIPNNFSLVITSPPYYGMKTYIQDQWLRMWFIGGNDDINYKNEDQQIKHTGQDTFIKELASVWKNVQNSVSDDLHLYVRFGSVPSIKSDPKFIFRSSIEEAGLFKIISTRNALDAHAGKRQADQMVPNSKAAVEYDFHVIRS